MNKQPHASAREGIVAKAIEDVAFELRLVDVADYIAFIRLEHLSCISDLVESAAELYFMPGALRLGHGAEACVDWSGAPKIVLDMELRAGGATIYFALTLTDLTVGVEVNYVSFDRPDADPEANTARLAEAIERVRIRKSQLLAEPSVSLIR